MDKRKPYFVFLAPIILGLIGLVMVYSSLSPLYMGRTVLPPAFLKQLGVFVFSVLLYLLIIKIRPALWIKGAYVFLGLSIIVLIFTVFRGAEINQAKRWINLGFITIQPSMFAQLSLIFYLAREKRFLQGLIGTIVVSLLILIQPDISGAFITLTLGLGILFIRGVQIKRLVLVFLIAGIVIFASGKFHGKSKRRIEIFVESTKEVKSTVLTMVHGGITGVGVGEGLGKFSVVPLPYSDYIFVTIGEEMGFFGTTLVLLLFLFYFLRGTKIVEYADKPEHRILGTGILLLIGMEALIHILTCVGLFPDSGEPLPFMSQGGSALIAYFLGAGIVGSIINESIVNWWRHRGTHTARI